MFYDIDHTTGNGLRHLSFVDVLGHAQLMQTMVLLSTSVSDETILVIDRSIRNKCPCGQTEQHMDAINLLGLMKYKHLIIAQNKIDLIHETKAFVSCEEIRQYSSTFGNDKSTHNT
eukprot:134706_1